ncbi:hypothetical protein WJX73_007920 [Symbiochloris irregularis]|uniref:Uncharacterized protein n=1 Tax=Symbiochloris irregularis TaxID=706552 RepID=A0AAW1NVA0_9CHLO
MAGGLAPGSLPRTTAHVQQCVTQLPLQHRRQNHPHAGRSLLSLQPARTFRLSAATRSVEELEGAELESWKACMSQVQDMGFSEEDAQKYLEKAFAWKRGYWGPEKKEPEVPSTDKLNENLGFLSEQLGIEGEDLKNTVSKFPQVLGLSIDRHLKVNKHILEHDYKLKGPAMTNVFKRKPQVLGNNYNCDGDCKGECVRCWVQF